MGAERLPFKALISDDPTHPAVLAETIRMDYNYNKDVFVQDFEEFCLDIEMLAYFIATQNGNYFSHYPELIPREHEHFWFNE